MILSKKLTTLAEVKALIKTSKDKKPMDDYLGEFAKLSLEKANSCIAELRAMNNPKLKDEHYVKIADIMPGDSAEINTIAYDLNLTEEESNAILAILKNY